MDKFVVGDRVISEDGNQFGEVTSGFYFRDMNGNPPKHGQVPVQWDNGNATYVDPTVLDYEIYLID